MSEKKISELLPSEKIAIVLTALQKEGYNQNQVAQLINMSRSRVCQVNKKVNKGTLNPLVNKAKKSVKLLLEGRPVGMMKEVKGADVLTAAKMVLDRSDPITVKTENTNVSLTLDIKPEERERYRAALGLAKPSPLPLLEENPPIAVEFSPVEEVKECVTNAESIPPSQESGKEDES